MLVLVLLVFFEVVFWFLVVFEVVLLVLFVFFEVISVFAGAFETLSAVSSVVMKVSTLVSTLFSSVVSSVLTLPRVGTSTDSDFCCHGVRMALMTKTATKAAKTGVKNDMARNCFLFMRMVLLVDFFGIIKNFLNYLQVL